MREIKFRLWDSENNVMVTSENVDSMIKKHDGDSIYSSDEWYPACEADVLFSFLDMLKRHKNITIEQFTGLYDKNGKEIYEGDIVSCDNDRWLCCWHIDSWRFSNLNGNLRQQDQWLTYALDDLEVIGNIHEVGDAK